MCAPFRQTHVHTHHTATVGPDLHPTMLASAGEGADGVAGLGGGPTPRGSSFVPLMLKNQSRMNHHKESWGGGRRRKGKGKGWGWGGEEERKGKRMKGEEGEEKGMGNGGDPRGYRGQRLGTEY